jgi:hypothetical protein
MEIITVIIILFGLTTVMGLYLSYLALGNKETPNPIIILHGFFTVVGFILLGFFYPESLTVIFYFGIATGFGLVLLYQDIKGIKYTQWLTYAHAVFTLAGCIYLIKFAAGLDCYT